VGSIPTPATKSIQNKKMRFIFDFIIIFILLFSGYWMYVIIRSFFYSKILGPKTKFWRSVILAFLAIVFTTIGWGSFVSPKIIKVTETKLNFNYTASHEAIKVVLLSDIHFGPYKKTYFAKKIVKKVKQLNPDLILLGGDYILGKADNIKYLEPIQELSKTIPTFAVSGNHEYNLPYDNSPKLVDKTGPMRKYFKKWGITILENKTEEVIINNNKINITGLPDIWTHRDNLHVAKYNLDPRTPNILLTHNPDIILKDNHSEFDLILSGHTHAGQVRLPLFGAIPPLPTTLGKAFDQGLFKLKNGQLYISAGLGESGPRARLFNHPEIATFTIDL
jgi:uncharacterized protein